MLSVFDIYIFETLLIEKIWCKSNDHSGFIKHRVRPRIIYICLVSFKKGQSRFLHLFTLSHRYFTISHRDLVLILFVGMCRVEHLRNEVEFLTYLRIWLNQFVLIHPYWWGFIWGKKYWRITITILLLLALFWQCLNHRIIHALMVVYPTTIPIIIALIWKRLLYKCYLALIIPIYSWRKFT